MHKVSLLLIVAIVFVSCAPRTARERGPATSFVEVTGNQATRVEHIGAILAQGGMLPTPLQDAQFVEAKIGDDALGPADYRAFVLLEVAPEAIPIWVDRLTPLDQQPSYAYPGQPYDWWLDETRFATLQFYGPDTLTKRTNGWIAIDATHGQIYIYTFTM